MLLIKAIVDEQISMIKSAYDKKEFNLKSRSKSPTLSKELNGEVFDYSNFLPKSVRNVNLGDQNRKGNNRGNRGGRGDRGGRGYENRSRLYRGGGSGY
jgi:hypothetical protein